MNHNRMFTLISLVLVAALFRIFPHPYNFTPVTAIALFGGANFNRKRDAFLVTLAVMLLSDLAIGFHSSMIAVYSCFALIVLLGSFLKESKGFLKLWMASLSGSILFFVVTNFSVWAFENMYEKSWAGLLACYAAALPFFQSTLFGDLFFATALFGAFAILAKKFQSLQSPHVFALMD